MLELRSGKPTTSEVEKIVSWLNDPVLMQYSEQRHKKHTVDTQFGYIYDLLQRPAVYKMAYGHNRLIGTVSAYIDSENNVADAGIMIGPDFIGQGYGPEVWRIFCKELTKLGIRKIEGGCMARNKPMIRVFEKNDMRLEGTRRYHFHIGKDEYDDMVLYGKLT